MWMGKASDDFNDSIALQGSQGPQIIANVGNAFTSASPHMSAQLITYAKLLSVVWVAYAFYAVPLIISLSKLNVKATK
jgi:hypothetical protein